MRNGGGSGGAAVGTAFAIDARHLLTCAHVVTKAGATGPGSRIAIDLLFDKGRRCTATVLAEGWQPEPRGDQPISSGDIALLEIDEDGPELKPLPLTRRRPPTGGKIFAYGFPKGHQESNIAEGLIGPPVGLAWRRIEQPTSALLQHGFSGGAIWSEALDAAIGMVVYRDEDNVQAAYAISIEAIAARSPIVEATLQGSPLHWLKHVPQRLRDALVDRRDKIAELTEHFVGRASIFRAIESRLEEPGFTSGYIFVEGEPGIGKSSVVAKLAEQRGWPHHFNILTAGQRSPAHFLTNICAQLILRYELERDTLPMSAGENPATLEHLLREAVARGPTPVVLLVDALDEAEPPADKGINRLLLPAELPSGSYVVATIRSHVPRMVVAKSIAAPILMLEDAPENIQDIRDFISHALDRSPGPCANLLREWKTDREKLIVDLAAKSEGNFMYVRHVLHELLESKASEQAPNLAESLDRLPNGLVEYYERHWTLMDMQAGDRFRNLLAPIIFFMAAAGGPVSTKDLADWINAQEEFAPTRAFAVADVLEGPWRQFVQTDGKAAPLYRLYHRSFLEFLERREEMIHYREMLPDLIYGQIEQISGELPPLQ